MSSNWSEIFSVECICRYHCMATELMIHAELQKCSILQIHHIHETVTIFDVFIIMAAATSTKHCVFHCSNCLLNCMATYWLIFCVLFIFFKPIKCILYIETTNTKLLIWFFKCITMHCVSNFYLNKYPIWCCGWY